MESAGLFFTTRPFVPVGLLTNELLSNPCERDRIFQRGGNDILLKSKP